MSDWIQIKGFLNKQAADALHMGTQNRKSNRFKFKT